MVGAGPDGHAAGMRSPHVAPPGEHGLRTAAESRLTPDPEEPASPRAPRPRGSPCRPPWPVRRWRRCRSPSDSCSRSSRRSPSTGRTRGSTTPWSDAAVLGPEAAAVRRHVARESALGDRLRDRVGRLARVRRSAAARADLARAGDLRLRHRGARVRHRAGPSGPARAARAGGRLVAFAGLVLLSLSLVGTQQIDHPPEPAEIGLWLACVAGGGVILAVSGSGSCARLRSGWPRGCSSRAATSAPSWSATAGGVARRPVVLVALLRARDEPPAGRLPARRRAHRGGPRDARDERRPDRRRFRRLRRGAPAGARGTLQLAAFASLVVGGALLSGVAARRSAAA